MICEFVGTFSKAEQDRITGALTALGGPTSILTLPRWTVLREQVGPEAFYIAVDHVRGGTCHGDTPDALVEAFEQRFGGAPRSRIP
jgi:hypothetical protein